ncbi:MAG: hypothetical protein ACREH4_02495, partial [Vitreimonas sp.]
RRRAASARLEPAMRRVLMVLAFACGAAVAAAAQTRSERGGVDANRDGVITRAEAETARAELFTRLDNDADGYLDEAELAAGPGAPFGAGAGIAGGKRLSGAEFMSRPYRLFERLDADSDGVLSQVELESARP